MAKVSIKFEEITPLGGIFHVRELFPRFLICAYDELFVLLRRK